MAPVQFSLVLVQLTGPPVLTSQTRVGSYGIFDQSRGYE